MNFKNFYINGNKFHIQINFNLESYWNSFMYKLTLWTTKKNKKRN